MTHLLNYYQRDVKGFLNIFPALVCVLFLFRGCNLFLLQIIIEGFYTRINRVVVYHQRNGRIHYLWDLSILPFHWGGSINAFTWPSFVTAVYSRNTRQQWNLKILLRIFCFSSQSTRILLHISKKYSITAMKNCKQFKIHHFKFWIKFSLRNQWDIWEGKRRLVSILKQSHTLSWWSWPDRMREPSQQTEKGWD